MQFSQAALRGGFWRFWAAVVRRRGLGRTARHLGRCARCEGLPAACGRKQLPQRRADVVPDDFFVRDIDVDEDRLVQLAACGFAGVDVQLVKVVEQVEVRVEEGSAAGEVAVHLAELLSDALSVAEALADAVLRERAVGGEVEEVVFLDGELRELVFEVLAEQLLCGGLVVQGGLDVAATKAGLSRMVL